jgi:3-methyladenine DNA glycosylase AlkD
VHYLIAPMVASKPARTRKIFRWAKSPNRWRRRAALRGFDPRRTGKDVPPEIKRLSAFLLNDKDDMVQKGLGWLLRETAKFDASEPFHISCRSASALHGWSCAPQCETLRRRGRSFRFSRRRAARDRQGPIRSNPCHCLQ